MIKQTWNIREDEKMRILKLHENATKSHYLFIEQNEENEISMTGGTGDIGDKRIQDAKVKIPDVEFNFPTNPITGQPGSEIAKVENGKVYFLWDGKFHEIPDINQINEPKFFPNPQNPYILDAVDEWEWLNSLNERNPRRQENLSTFYIPAYGRSLQNWSVHYLTYNLVRIKKTRGREETDDFLQANDNRYVRYPKNAKYIVKGDSSISWGGIPVKSEPTTQPTTDPNPNKDPDPIPPLNLDSPFKYDQVILEPEAQKQFNKFVEEVKNRYKGATGKVTVTTSSSIDGDPNQKVKGGITRQQYDLDLSVRRANAIIEILEKEWQSIGFSYVPNPLGETDKFAPGKTGPNGFKISETSPNRKLIIQLPPLKK